MKKRIFLILISIVLLSTFACGCKKDCSLLESVSRLRADVLYGKDENFSVTLYPETRETPLIADGNMNNSETVVIVKLKTLSGQTGRFEVKFATDREYTLDFTFSAYSDCYVASVAVGKLPYNTVNATIYHNDVATDITLTSLLNADTVSPEKALLTVEKEKAEYIEQNSVSGVFKGEVYVRLICENGKNFWYVGLITKDRTLAMLLDGKSGQILSEKSLLNTQG